MEREPLGVLGAGWVGLVTAASFAGLGHRVVVRDVDPERVHTLADGRVPIYEPALAEAIVESRDRLEFTLDVGDVLASASVLFVCVGTPSTY